MSPNLPTLTKRTPMRPVRIDALCDCGGVYKPAGYSFPTFPMLYGHRCDKCGRDAKFRQEYPAIEYEEAPATGSGEGR